MQLRVKVQHTLATALHATAAVAARGAAATVWTKVAAAARDAAARDAAAVGLDPGRDIQYRQLSARIDEVEPVAQVKDQVMKGLRGKATQAKVRLMESHSMHARWT